MTTSHPDFYTYRAKIAIQKMIRPGVYLVQPNLRSIRGSMLSPRHKYVLITYGVDRDNHAHPISAHSAKNWEDLLEMTHGIPLITVEPTQRVHGPLAPSYGRWRLEYLPQWGRGVTNIHSSAWRKKVNAYGSLVQMRRLLAHLLNRNIRNWKRYRPVYRLVIDQDVNQMGTATRHYNLFTYYKLNKLKPWLENVDDEDKNALAPDEI